MEDQNLSAQQQDNIEAGVMASLGEPSAAMDQENDTVDASEGGENATDSLSIQKRLKRQKRVHEREIRDLHARIGELQSRLPDNQNTSMNRANDFDESQGIDEQIHKAVSYALKQKEMQERAAKDAESREHVNRKYQELVNHLDGMNDKYDDFHETVQSDHQPFTGNMRDTALFLPHTGPGSAGEVLYKLGKNPSELKRIAALHPLDQAREMVKLSNALISGGASDSKSSQSRPIGNIKSNPVTNSKGINENTTPSEIRARMKAGKFK